MPDRDACSVCPDIVRRACDARGGDEDRTRRVYGTA